MQAVLGKIEQIPRLGRVASGRACPVIRKFGNFCEKREVLQNTRKHKGTRIFINEEGFSENAKAFRHKLWDSAREDRHNGDKVCHLINSN